MEFLDAVLPIFVDYLGRFEGEPGAIERPSDVMTELLANGVTDKRFLPNGELSVVDGRLVLKDNLQRIIAESFDLNQIRDPVAFISRENARHQKSGFSRVVIITEEGAGHFGANYVFHAFQCLDNNPEDLVQMIENATSPDGPHSQLHRLDSLDSNWMMNGQQQQQHTATVRPRAGSPYSSAASSVVAAPPTLPPLVTAETDRALLFDKPRRQYENSDSLVEKFTILLNFCIEDIERFCAEVRAAKQGEGAKTLDEIQAVDFTKIFQKFKLAFNFLGFLQGSLRDPDASELLHHLFPPLAFLVDVCYELFGDDLVRDIVSPLPTRKAVTLMTQNLNPREQVIWKALGDYWRQPKENFQGNILVYRPVFQGGWSPGVVVFPDEDDGFMARHGSDRSKITSSMSSLEDAVFKPSNSSVTSHDEFRDELMGKQARIGLVTFSRERQNPRELTVRKGEYLHVMDDERNWWKCKNSEGEVGFVPHTLLKAIIYQDKFDLEEKNYEESRKKKKSSRRGRSYSSSSDEAPKPRRAPSPTPSIPPPAPPMPAGVYKQPELRPRKPKVPYNPSATVRSTTSLQEELKTVMSVYNERETNLNIMTTPDVYITQKSTPSEVRNWLKAKQFSQRALDQMAGMHGGNLFKMTRKDLIAAFGKEEGKRLDSQITISRNTAGFKTARSSELKEILEKARRRSEKEKKEMEEEESEESDEDFSRV